MNDTNIDFILWRAIPKTEFIPLRKFEVIVNTHEFRADKQWQISRPKGLLYLPNSSFIFYFVFCAIHLHVNDSFIDP